MNYRHIYHAGNICDVVKHAMLALIIDYLKQKDKPFAVLDTHAGCGLYDLDAPEARKTGEADEGVQRLWFAWREGRTIDTTLTPFLDALNKVNMDGLLRYYPGSPMLARTMLREHDRLIACELHPEDCATLRRTFRHNDKQAHIHHRDGYEALRGLLPFPEKRGLILIDPPFEKPDDFDNLIAACHLIHSLFPQAIVAIWYPIKDRPTVWQFHERLRDTKIPKIMNTEFIYQPEVRSDRLNGTGMIIINPPWVLEEQLPKLFGCLHDILQTEAKQSTISALT